VLGSQPASKAARGGVEPSSTVRVDPVESEDVMDSLSGYVSIRQEGD